MTKYQYYMDLSDKYIVLAQNTEDTDMAMFYVNVSKGYIIKANRLKVKETYHDKTALFYT